MALTAISPLDGRYAAQVQSLAPFFPPQQRAACPARVPPRAAGLQAALAGVARRVPRPRPGCGGTGGGGGGGRRGDAKRAFEFPIREMRRLWHDDVSQDELPTAQERPGGDPAPLLRPGT